MFISSLVSDAPFLLLRVGTRAVHDLRRCSMDTGWAGLVKVGAVILRDLEQTREP